MEDKINKTKKVSLTPAKKVRWHHSRWFWGMVLGVVFILTCLCGMDILSEGEPNSDILSATSLFLFQLPMGLFIIGGIKSIAILYKFIDTSFYLYLTIYYIGLLILLFKTIQRKKVKIKYPLMLIIIVMVSIFGFIVLNGVS